MGYYIKYKGQLHSPQDVHRIVEEFTDIAKTMKWYHRIEDRDWTVPDDICWRNNPEHGHPEVFGHAGIKGICFKVHDHCEPLFLFFNREGVLMDEYTMAFRNSGYKEEEMKMPWLRSKTSNAGVEAHKAMCKLLRYIEKKYFKELHVEDDTEYWETNDEGKLRGSMLFMSTIIGVFKESEKRKEKEGGKSLLDIR